MDSRQTETFEGAHLQYDEADPPPPYHVATGETGPSPQQCDSERATSPIHHSRLETEDAAAPLPSPTPTSPQSEAYEAIDYLRRVSRSLRLGLPQTPADWDRIEASVSTIHDQMVAAKSQLAQSRRQRRLDAHVRMSLESRLHSTQTSLIDAEIRVASAETRVRLLERHSDQLKAAMESSEDSDWGST